MFEISQKNGKSTIVMTKPKGIEVVFGRMKNKNGGVYFKKSIFKNKFFKNEEAVCRAVDKWLES
jgi:hypothetical protein